MAGTLTITGMSAGLVSGQKTIGPITTSGSNPIGQIDDTTLNSGDNTFTVPTGYTAVAIFLGQSPNVTVKLRTNLNALEAGLQIAPVAVLSWAKFDLPVGVTSVILNSSGSLAGVEIQFI